MNIELISALLSQQRQQQPSLQLSSEDYLELLLKAEEFKAYLDKLSFDLIKGLRRPAYNPPPRFEGASKGQRAAWPQSNPFGQVDPVFGFGLGPHRK